MRRLGVSAFLASAALSLTGCVSGPDFQRPATFANEYVTGRDTAAREQSVTEEVAEFDWWERFEDPLLIRLVARALQNSPSIETAVARMEQAEALLDAARGSRLPSVIADGTAAQLRTVSPNLAGAGVDPALELTSYSADVRVSYDLDLFGKGRRRVEAAAARANEARFGLQGARLLLAGEVVSTYIEQGYAVDELTLRAKQIEALETRLELMEERRNFGLERGAATIDAAAELEQLRAQLPAIQQMIDQNVHRIAVLTGRFPSELELESVTLQTVLLPIEIAAGIPSELVRHRPDILAAEARLMAANAEIDIATADLYPQLTITASGGMSGFEGVGSILEPVWTLGTGLLAPIFEGGRRRAEKRAAEANLRAELGRYRSVVLNSFEQVANALRAIEHDADAMRATDRAAILAKESHELALARFNAGLDTYTPVLLAERRARDAEIAQLRTRANWLANTALLLSAVAPAGDAQGDLFMRTADDQIPEEQESPS